MAHRPARPSDATLSASTAKKKLLRVAGLPAVAALFATAPQRVERLFFTREFKPRVAEFCALLARARKPFRLVGDEELGRVAGTVLHGGVVAVAAPRPLGLARVADAQQWAAERRPLLLLDGIGNPHNLGAIVRTAAFFGLPRIVLSDHPAQASPSDASYRVAEGGLEHVALYRGVPFVDFLRGLGQSHLVVGAAAQGGRPFEALPRSAPSGSNRPIALVLGNEEDGLPRATLAACDQLVTIPGVGAVQSLNVAASAAILLHLLTR
jgi:TrmH RNA methyltransferase